MCKRVQQRITCETCGYPASEALFDLTPGGQVIEPFTGRVVGRDPGCEYEAEDLDVLDMLDAFPETYEPVEDHL